MNAKQHAREAEIIAQAGRPKMITIATNMAGRGTDIVLGGNVERQSILIEADESLSDAEKAKRIQQLKDEGKVISNVYPEIDLIRETELLKEKNPEDQFIEKTNIKMNFLGLDLSKIPQQNMTDYTVYIIPVLYILSSFISIRITTAKQQKDKEDKKSKNIDGNTGKEIEEENNEMDAVMQTNKMMSWFVPIMSISIAFIAPLGLALYWLISNILMIAERLIIDKVVKS